MLDIFVHLGIIVLNVAQFVAFFAAPVLGIVIIIKAIKASFFCNLTVADLIDCTYTEEVVRKRDRDYDSYSYEMHRSDPDVIVHTKAYKRVTDVTYHAIYRYIVHGNAYFKEISEYAGEKESGKPLSSPEQTVEVYYLKNKPQKCFTKQSYITLVVWEIILMVFIWLSNYATDAIRTTSSASNIPTVILYALPVLLLISIFRRKPDTEPQQSTLE